MIRIFFDVLGFALLWGIMFWLFPQFTAYGSIILIFFCLHEWFKPAG